MKKNGLTYDKHEFLIYNLHELIVGGDITCVIITLPVTAKWAIVVSSNLETKNDNEKILTASTVGPSLSTHLKNPTARFKNMEMTLTLSWTMF